MRIALINGSPKTKRSSSGFYLEEARKLLGQNGNDLSQHHFKSPHIGVDEIEQMSTYDVLIFAFPLYVDGIPSNLLHCLAQLETSFVSKQKKDIKVYCLVNCGFFEAHQNALAIEMMKIWSAKAGLEWGGGVGIGAGQMLANMENVPMGHGPKKDLGKCLHILVRNISNQDVGETLYVTANFPRVLFRLFAEMGWRKAAKKHGLKPRELSRRMTED